METPENKSVGFTTLEVCLFFVLFTTFVSGSALGAGYWLGSQRGGTSEIVGMCNRLDAVHEARLEAVKVGHRRTDEKMKNYETFLTQVGLNPTLPPPKRGRGGR